MNYALTVFAQTGEMLLNESFTFDSDQEAIDHGRERLQEESYMKTTHRLVRSGELLLFYR
ncbi:YhzD family protein [Natribacillus halophilus]|uniref:YhzD-like protein n=1 Tax=Natribacillus halophilus TaxID=549003 RepID=A0A1G8NVM0_9BACI|nr:YhzD family protein [Natribacillus halophilus]SDI84168.1 YhzD-like protein [Natribacillus halophilus]